ncbi:MAG: hypothetical protein U5K99_04280 [Anaerolineales bacterium]|nr:hypothetical protein [Anaerolineales bacterium]
MICTIDLALDDQRRRIVKVKTFRPDQILPLATSKFILRSSPGNNLPGLDVFSRKDLNQEGPHLTFIKT